MNLPNRLTMLRVFLIPVFLCLFYLPFPGHFFFSLAVFIAASLTDMLDGRIARSRGLITDFGKFMDPLADKVLVMAAMTMLVSWGQMPAWVLLVVILREFAVTALRLVAVEGGRVIAAAWSGKIKTATTMVCICLMLLPISEMLNLLCWAAILLTTIYSGVEYFVKNKDVIDWTDM